MNIITAVLLCVLSSSSLSRMVVSFQPIRAIVGRTSRQDTTITTPTTTRLLAVSESGIETGVIKGIQEDSEEIDFGRCGVKLAEETAVRMSGQVLLKNTNAASATTAEWTSLDNVLKLSPMDRNNSNRDSSSSGGGAAADYTILATASAVEDYKDPGQGTVKEVLYAPDECVKAILKEIPTVTAPRIVINVAGGNDLQIAEVLDAVVKLSTAFNTDAQIVWNSIAFKDFPLGAATMVVVAMQQKLETMEDMATEPFCGLAVGEIYQQNGAYFTVDEKDIVTDFSEDWML